jgi:hypothetical protein
MNAGVNEVSPVPVTTIGASLVNRVLLTPVDGNVVAAP